MEYRVVETSTVTDEELERLINELVCLGWELEDIRFVTKESSRRPAMAFLFFVRPSPSSGDCPGPGRS